MAPKNNLPAAKLSTILAWFRTSLTAHTLKDLEKALPTVASINGMAVKDYVQALTDEGKIHVEKIGSGNWYWSFASEETKLRQAEMAKLKAESEAVEVNVAELTAKVKAAKEERADGEGEEREELVKRHEGLVDEVGMLKRELATYANADPAEVERKRKEVEGFKKRAERWTDNLMLVEGYMGKMMGGDRESMDALRREIYGDQYIEGEGLAEL